jgi:hypothetical protein
METGRNSVRVVVIHTHADTSNGRHDDYKNENSLSIIIIIGDSSVFIRGCHGTDGWRREIRESKNLAR